MSFSSPTAARMRSMSRTASSVPTWGRRSPLRCWHPATNRRVAWISAAFSSASSGVGSVAKYLPSSAVGRHRTGELCPVPRGSKPTMSNRAFTPVETRPSRSGRASTPEAPGPPGLISSEPMRRPWSVARRRFKAMPIWRPPGWSWSSGTCRVAHSYCPHGAQARVDAAGGPLGIGAGSIDAGGAGPELPAPTRPWLAEQPAARTMTVTSRRTARRTASGG